jgi:polysaccharide pyruvyl transferase WcaK-like protein
VRHYRGARAAKKSMKMNFAVPFGFYGAGNIGDESTLQGFARLLSSCDPNVRAWVGSGNPSHTKRVEPFFSYFKNEGFDPRRWLTKRRASAHVFAGGTPIMDVAGPWPLNIVGPIVVAACASGKPVVFIGTGIEGLHRQASKRIVSEVLAPTVIHWSVRSERDKNRLVACNVPAERITAAADLAWLLDPVSADFGVDCLRKLGVDPRGPLLGVNINHERHMTEREPLFFEKLTAILDEIIVTHNVRVIFLCNEVREEETFDKAASERVLRAMKHRDRALLVPNEYRSPQQMLSLIACCRATLSTRYHFCLFSALQKVPFVALKRSDKVDDLCWDFNWPYGVSLDELSAASMIEMFTDIERKKASLEGCMEKRAQTMRQRALKNSIAIDALVNESEK